MNPTDAVVSAGLVFYLVWESWALVNKRKYDTISETVWKVVKRRPLVPFAIGMLMGHWIWLPDACWELF